MRVTNKVLGIPPGGYYQNKFIFNISIILNFVFLQININVLEIDIL